jgi:hypothetical protein
MARPYYPAASLGYQDTPGELDDEKAAIERRRLQLIDAMKTPIGGPGTGWKGGVANFLQGMAGNMLLEGQDTRSKDLAQRRAAAAQDWLDRMPTGTAAQAEVNPSAPLAGEEGPPLPTTYKPRDASYFADEQRRLEEQRRMLAGTLAAPAPDSGYKGKFYVPNYGAAQKGLQDAIGMYAQNELSGQEQALAQRRSAAAQQWLERMPTGAPAQPEVNPSMPAAGEEGPPLPTNYAPPDATGGMVPRPPSYPSATPTYEHKDATPFLPAKLNDLARWSAEGAGFSPFHAAVASHTVQKAIDAPVREEELRVAREAKAEEARQRAQDRSHERTLANIEWDRRSEISAAERERQATNAQADRAADREHMLRVAASMRPQPSGNAASTSSGDFSKTGDEFLATLDPQDAGVIRKIASGEIPLTTFSTRGGHRETLAKAVAAYDPTYNVTRPATWREFTTGPTAKNITSINTSLGHMGTMASLADAMQNNDPRVLNAALNRIATEVGDPRITNYETARQAVGEELMRTFRVTGASERESQAWMDKFKSSNSPEQLRGAIKTAGELLHSRIKAVDDQWKRGTQSKTGFPGLISSENEATLERLGIKRSGAEPAAPAAASGPASSTPKKIANAAEYAALPSGATFIGPDGVQRTKK